jgi:YVTN family beta-propeller protein
MKKPFRFALLCSALMNTPLLTLGQTAQEPVPGVPDPGVITTGQQITPAGVQTVFDGRGYGVVFGGSEDKVWVLVSGPSRVAAIYQFSWQDNRLLRYITAPKGEGPGMQSLQYDSDGQGVFFGVNGGKAIRIRATNIDESASESTRIVVDSLGHNVVGGLALARQDDSVGRRILVAPLTYNDTAAIADIKKGTVLAKVPVGIAPFGAVINAAGTVAYVSNWGGRVPHSGDVMLNSGDPSQVDTADRPDPDKVVVDSRGVASTGTVTRIDLATLRATASIPVGLHPNGMIWDEAHGRLYVSNGNSDTVSVIDTARQTVVRTITIQPFQHAKVGIAPTSPALNAAGDRLYVACGGINAIAVFDVSSSSPQAKLMGLIPTGWYPNALAMGPDSKHLAVTALYGVGSGWQHAPNVTIGPEKGEVPDSASRRYVHSYRGSLNVIDVPDDAQLASFTQAVAANVHLPLAGSEEASSSTPKQHVAAKAIPDRPGDPSLIEHVVYIVKENRAYDQYFGDFKKGNGDPNLVLFTEDSTPNHRRIADQFVLLDNTYATGGNSGDGHQWATQANETDYTLWPGYGGRSYPFGGDDPLAMSSGGAIWDAALRNHKSVEVLGEYVGYGTPEGISTKEAHARSHATEESSKPSLKEWVDEWRAGKDFTNRFHNTAANRFLNPIMAHDYPAWEGTIPDVVRSQVFLAHLKRWEAKGSMPNLVIATLPQDHTDGYSPGKPTPKACVADNDWAVGKVVEGLSHSKFWKSMAIFVIEDDAQGGVDHVDGHRTVALVASPYAKHGSVDSTFYAQQSVLKTIELILGLGPMSIFDLTANSMSPSFTDTPDLTPYDAVEPKQDITELAPPLSALNGPARKAALASLQMDFSLPDAAPSDKLNRIIWESVRGWTTPYPSVRHSLFFPMSMDLADDEREERRDRD